MKRITFAVLLASFFLWSHLSARRVSSVNVQTPELNPSVKEMAGEYRDINTLVEKARRDAAQAQRKAQREIEEIHGRMSRRQSRLERRRQEALRKEAAERAMLEQRTREQAEAVAKDAQVQAQAIIEQAEKRAVELRAKLQEQDRQDRAASRPKITSKWRREILAEYDADIAIMRKVIMEGEPSRIERENFSALFEEQRAWLKQTIDKVVFFFDDSYAAVMKKKNNLSGLIDAQRQADEIILDIVDQHHLSSDVQAQLRLMAMYELNNHLQSNQGSQVFLDADVIRGLVSKVTSDVAPGQREIRVVSEKERIGTLEKRIAELEQQLAKQEEGDDADVARVDEDMPDNLDAFEQKQEALYAGRKSNKQRIAELEKEKEETLVALEKKREEEVFSIKQDSESRIAQLTKERDQLLADKVHETDDAAASLQEQIDELEKEKEEAVAKTEEISKLRIKKLKKAHEQARHELLQQRERAVAEVRKQLDALRKEKEAASQKLAAQELDLAGERAKAKQLSDQLADVQGAVTTLKDTVSELKSEREKLSEEHKKEQDAFISRIERKQKEKASLEVHLSQVKQHLFVLTSQSSKRLLALANQVSQQSVTQEDLIRLLEQKTQERVELELAVETTQQQLQELTTESEEVLRSLADQLNWYENQCTHLQSLLEGKQAVTVELETLVNKMHEANSTVYNQAVQSGIKAETLSRERNELRDRVAQLQRALGALRQQQKLQGQHDAQLVQQAQALTKQSLDEVARLTALLERQQQDLHNRRHSFIRMQQLQNTLHALRAARQNDPVRDAQQAEVLAQMAAFGDQVLNNYARIDRAVHDTGTVYDELAPLVMLFADDDAFVSDDSLEHLDHALGMLGQTAHVNTEVPVRPREEVLYAPKKNMTAVSEQEEEEEEEAPHEPDDHGDHPEEVEDVDGEVDADSISDSVENFLSDQADNDGLGDADDTEPQEDQVPEEVVALAPDHNDASDEEDEDEEDEDEEDDDESKKKNKSGLSDTVLDILSGDEDDGW